MDITLTTWLTIPAIGGVIGYVTNRLAVKMIFRPIRPVNVLGMKIQGLMPRRQKDMAESIGAVVGDHLLSHEDLAKGFSNLPLEEILGEVLEAGIGPKIAELRSLPLIGGFLTEDRIDELRKSLVDGVLKNKARLMSKLEEALEKGLDVRSVVQEKVAAFPVTKLEALVLQVAAKELRAIEILGGILGIVIGLGQVVLLHFVG